MKLTSGVKKALRQKAAMIRLQKQLDTGLKTVKGSKDKKDPLSKSDITRINREIKTIENKIRDRFPHLLEEKQAA